MKKLMYIAVSIMLLAVGCKEHKKDYTAKEGKDIKAFPGAYEVDSVMDIQAYFDSIHLECGADVWTHNPEIGESLEVWDAVRELHRYVNHQRKYYPVEDVNKAIQHMAFEQGYIFNHSGEAPDSVNAGEVFLFRFIEQAATHSPQLDFITDFHAEGGEAGILYYPEWSTINPLYSFLVYKTKHGYKVLTIGKKGDAKVNRIFHLVDRHGRVYYLCSNNDDTIYFRQYLYGWDGETMTLLCEKDGIDWGRYDDGYKIVFNPKALEWNYCLPKGGVYQKVEGTSTHILTLDWKNSMFGVIMDYDELSEQERHKR